jgi:hypothetical protein
LYELLPLAGKWSRDQAQKLRKTVQVRAGGHLPVQFRPYLDETPRHSLLDKEPFEPKICKFTSSRAPQGFDPTAAFERRLTGTVKLPRKGAKIAAHGVDHRSIFPPTRLPRVEDPCQGPVVIVLQHAAVCQNQSQGCQTLPHHKSFFGRQDCMTKEEGNPS